MTKLKEEGGVGCAAQYNSALDFLSKSGDEARRRMMLLHCVTDSTLKAQYSPNKGEANDKHP